MPLKPQDLVISLALAARDEPVWTYAELAASLGLSASEANKGVVRAVAAGLLTPGLEQGAKPAPARRALLEFAVHGARYAFFARPGPVSRGVPTAWATAPLDAWILAGEELPPVWPSPLGSVRGQAIEPLYRSVPAAALKDQALHELLALVDALRIGRVRERELASRQLEARLLG